MIIRPVAAELFQADVQTQTDKCNLADSHFSQFCECTKKRDRKHAFQLNRCPIWIRKH